jgi:hypothetical protein
MIESTALSGLERGESRRSLAAPLAHRFRFGLPARRYSLFLLGAVALWALAWTGERWESALATAGSAAEPLQALGVGLALQQDLELHPLYVLLKLGTATLIGLMVTAVQRTVGHDRKLTRSMEQAQTLLCLAGALMMIIIGNSLARAFGIAGAAAIIRFRTPVEDPRDITILFLLMALGMAAGIGALSMAALGALCLCLLLPALDRFSQPPPRVMAVEFVARGAAFPSAHVHGVFERHRVTYEAREIAHGDPARVKYRTWVEQSVSLEELSNELLRDGGIASLSWETKKG